MTDAPDLILCPAALTVILPPDRHTVAEWADAHRVLDPIYSPGEPGPYSSARTPYLRGIWAAWQDHNIRQVTLIKPTQVGGTEALMNMIGHSIAEDPGPMMLVLPSQNRSREFRDRIVAMVRESPTLRQFEPKDKADDLRSQVRYGAAQLYLRGAESPSDLASVAVRKVLVDEADKVPTSTAGGREAGTIQLVRHRLRTVRNSKLYINSTPTTRVGPIWQEWEKSDQRRYWVPCVHCEEWQLLEFAHIKWPEGATATDIENGDLATYHCPHCAQEISHTLDRSRMLAQGEWRAAKPTGRHAGFHLNALYSPWLTWSQIAVEHLRARTVSERQDFTNGYLGWIFEEQVDKIDSAELRKRAGGYHVGEVPDWVRSVFLGVDCGKREVHYDVRGFGAEGKTCLIEAGRIVAIDLRTALRELAEKVLERDYGKHRVRLAFIDSGYKPATVARFCKQHRRCRAVIGRDENRDGAVLTQGVREKTIAGRDMSFPVIRVDITQVQDQIADTMQADGRWLVPDDVPEDWFRHMAAEHAVIERKAGRDVKRWRPYPGGGANHWLDACRYAFAAAYACKAWWLPAKRAKAQPRGDDIEDAPAPQRRAKPERHPPRISQRPGRPAQRRGGFGLGGGRGLTLGRR